MHARRGEATVQEAALRSAPSEAWVVSDGVSDTEQVKEHLGSQLAMRGLQLDSCS